MKEKFNIEKNVKYKQHNFDKQASKEFVYYKFEWSCNNIPNDQEFVAVFHVSPVEYGWATNVDKCGIVLAVLVLMVLIGIGSQKTLFLHTKWIRIGQWIWEELHGTLR